MTSAKAMVLLAELLPEYFHAEELFEIAAAFSVELEWRGESSDWLRTSRAWIEGINVGNNRALLDALVEQLEMRNGGAAVHHTFERRQYHESLTGKVHQLRSLLGEPEVPREVSVAERQEFRAKSELREFLGLAETNILLVDPYVGVGTLDCLRDVRQSVRLLTGTGAKAIENGFERALKEFRAEGHEIDVRRHDHLHDRHAVFNQRCWLIGSSMKDAGRKAFNCIEVIDGKAAMVADLEAKWSGAVAF
jgi:hypothetical protein